MASHRHKALVLGGYRVLLRDGRGRFTTLTRAKKYQLKELHGKKRFVFKEYEAFPADFRRFAERVEYIENRIHAVEERKKKATLQRRARYWKNRSEKLRQKLDRARTKKSQRELEKEVEEAESRFFAEQDALFDYGFVREQIEKSVFSTNRQASMKLKIEMNFHDPIPFHEDNMEDVLALIRPKITDRLEEIWRKLKNVKQKQFLIRVLYRDSVAGKREIMGFGIPRMQISQFENLSLYVDELTDEMFDRFVQNEKSYFRRNFVSSEPEIVGFTIENVEKERKIPKREIVKWVKWWAKTKDKMMRKKLETKERYGEERRRRRITARRRK